MKIATLDRLISGDRYDPILIAGKTIGLEWATVRALILLRLGPNRMASPADIESARVNFARLMPSTAERVVELLEDAPAGVSAFAERFRGCRVTLARRRASRFCPGMTNSHRRNRKYAALRPSRSALRP